MSKCIWTAGHIWDNTKRGRLVIITEFRKIAKGRVQIYLNDEPSFVLNRGEMNSLPVSDIDKCRASELFVDEANAEYGIVPFKDSCLYVGMDITDELYDYILDMILLPRAKRRAMNILLKQDRTEKQLSDKLREGMYPQQVIDAALAYVKSYSYVDDERYVRSYVSYRCGTKSRRALAAELAGKGIDLDLAERVLDEVYQEEEIDESAVIVALAEKKLGGRLQDKLPPKEDEKGRLKLYRYLVGKGFSYDSVRKALYLNSF